VIALWALLAIYAAARPLQMFPASVPMVVTVGLHVLSALAFALVHGAKVYGRRGILTFLLICVVIGNLIENLGVLTGFPFGRYHFTDVMGPKLFVVPILLGLAYIGMGYVSWTVARVILGDAGEPLAGSRLVTRPLVAAFIMVAWDFSQEAVWANFVHAWKWHEGGPFFGVPLTNFVGWYLTVYLIYQTFALTVRGKPMPVGSQCWLTAVLFYGVSALGNLLVPAPAGVSVITDGAGTSWAAAGILGTSALVSMLVMGAFTLLALVRLMDTATAGR
jgi:putative membrane protein